jgi:hypothetical protein
MFEGLRGRARAAALQAAAIEAKVAIGALRSALAHTEREATIERQHLEDAERRGGLAREVADAETTAVAERFAAKHRERLALLEKKLLVQHEELALAERELAEMTEALKAAQTGTPAEGQPGAWRDPAAGAPRPESGAEDALLRQRMDRAMNEAAAEAQLAQLKKKLGKDKT